MSMADYSLVATGGYVGSEPASTKCVLIFGLGGTWRVDQPGGRLKQLASFACGPTSAPAAIDGVGQSACIEITMPAWMGRSLIPQCAEAKGLAVFAGDLSGLSVELAERVACADSMSQASRLLSEAFLRRADQIDLRAPRSDVWSAWRRMATHPGRLRVRDMAADLGLSERQFRRKFNDLFGVEPKTALRVLRFEHAFRDLAEGACPLCEVASAHGYADQSHLTREVVAFAGRTPAEIRSAAQRSAPPHLARDD